MEIGDRWQRVEIADRWTLEQSRRHVTIRQVKREKEQAGKGSKETKKEGDSPINVIHVAGYTQACRYPRSVFISSLLKGTEIVPELREAQSTKLCRRTMRDSGE